MIIMIYMMIIDDIYDDNNDIYDDNNDNNISCYERNCKIFAWFWDF